MTHPRQKVSAGSIGSHRIIMSLAQLIAELCPSSQLKADDTQENRGENNQHPAAKDQKKHLRAPTL
jgi:hypothetical protein